MAATDAEGEIDQSPASHEWTVETPTPPQTTIDTGPPSATLSTSAAFTFSASEPSSFQCSLDNAAFAACTSPVELTGLAAGPHTFRVQATDLNGNPDSSPASVTWTITTCGTTTTVTANADSWLEEASPTSNKGTDSDLKVKSQGPNGNFRAIVRFPLPAAAPAGCVVESATLRMFASSSAPGRTLAAATAGGPWAENTVNWVNQPGANGSPATTASGQGWREWNVAAQLQALFDSGANNGFLIQDANEGGPGAEQSFNSRTHSQNRPQLVFRFAEAPPPPPPDTTPPNTTIGSGPPASTSATTASFTFASNENGTFHCSLDQGSFVGCTSPQSYTGLSVGPHTFLVQATDAAGNVEEEPASHAWTITTPPVNCGSATTVNAVADAWVDQSSPSTNKGTDSNLKVMSKNGNSNLRSLVRFDLPAAPAGCVVQSATLRLNSGSAVSGRTLQALQVGSAWTESAVTWANQPATTGAAATTSSGTGWREWAVTSQVQAMYAGANHGFLIRDAAENSPSSPEQSFSSRESGGNRPQLVVTFAPAG